MSPVKPVALIGVPTNSSGTENGVALAPRALREAGLLSRIANSGTVHDLGDIPILSATTARDSKTGIIAPQTFYNMVLGTAEHVKNALNIGWFPLVVGGDCGLLLGCLIAARSVYGQPGLLFVDGHEDAYPPHASDTGETADMEMGFALGRHLENLPPDFAAHFPVIGESDVAILGARDRDILEKEGVPSLEAITQISITRDTDIRLSIVEEAVNRQLDFIHAADRKWWLHVDLDVLSTDALPSVDYQQPGGLDWDTLTALTRQAFATRDGLPAPNLVGWDITIYNPDLDPTQRDAARIVEYIASVFA